MRESQQVRHNSAHPVDALQLDVVIVETLTHCLTALFELNPVQGYTPLATNILVNSTQYFVGRESVTGLQNHIYHLLHRGKRSSAMPIVAPLSGRN